MNRTLLWKLGVILGTLFVFLFGIFGVPKSFSGQGLLASVGDHIHLGLDLRGGTHLILQVQVNDAVNVDAQNAIEVLKQQMRTRKVDYAEILQADPPSPDRVQTEPDHIVIKGVQASGRNDL